MENKDKLYSCRASTLRPNIFSYADMVEANADDDDVLTAIDQLRVGESVVFGGGAWGISEIRRIS